MFTALKSYFNMLIDVVLLRQLISDESCSMSSALIPPLTSGKHPPNTHTPRPATSQNVPCDMALAHLSSADSFTDPTPPFLEASPGETVQRLNRAILIHDTTFEQKHFLYSFIKQQKQKKKRREETEKSGFCSAFWLWCVPPPQGGGRDTCKWWRRVFVCFGCWSRCVSGRRLSSG